MATPSSSSSEKIPTGCGCLLLLVIAAGAYYAVRDFLTAPGQQLRGFGLFVGICVGILALGFLLLMGLGYVLGWAEPPPPLPGPPPPWVCTRCNRLVSDAETATIEFNSGSPWLHVADCQRTSWGDSLPQCSLHRTVELLGTYSRAELLAYQQADEQHDGYYPGRPRNLPDPAVLKALLRYELTGL